VRANSETFSNSAITFGILPAMRKRVQIALAVLLVAVAGVLAWLVLREPEPIYQGKRLSFWLYQYERGGEEERNRAQTAIRKIGTNAIPTLLNMLVKRDSATALQCKVFWNNHVRLHFGFPPWYKDVLQNDEALQAFEILGADAQQAVPQLISTFEQNISPESLSNFCEQGVMGNRSNGTRAGNSRVSQRGG
jgi:hypothetical protein